MGDLYMPLAEIKINTLGGSPIAFHNMPCSICGKNKAVLDMNTGHFQPCRICEREGYRTIKLNVFWKWWFSCTL